MEVELISKNNGSWLVTIDKLLQCDRIGDDKFLGNVPAKDTKEFRDVLWMAIEQHYVSFLWRGDTIVDDENEEISGHQRLVLSVHRSTGMSTLRRKSLLKIFENEYTDENGRYLFTQSFVNERIAILESIGRAKLNA